MADLPRMPVAYSVCITHRNNAPTLERSLDSILGQINDEFEVIVVDSVSTDGSLPILERYAETGKIKLIVKRCNRGKGRQLAFEAGRGRTVIANLDMDEVYAPRLWEALSFFERRCSDKLLLVTSSVEKAGRETQYVTIGRRDTIKEIGGWRDLNHTEDWELWRRAAAADKFARTGLRLVTDVHHHPERHRSLWVRERLRYQRYSEMIRVNQYLFKDEPKIHASQRIMSVAARVGTAFSKHYGRDLDPLFTPFDPKYSIEMTSAN
jgi:glycosyltransferase involved in cell wall biosynthesis